MFVRTMTSGLRTNTSAAQHFRIRTQLFTYTIFGVLIGPVAVLWVFLAWSHPTSNDWEGAAIAGALLGGLWLWFFFLEVDLQSDRLVVRTLFGGHELRYSEIRKVETVVRRYRGATGRAWAIYDSAQFAARPLKIPIAPFRASDQQKIAETLVERAPDASIDSWTRSVAGR